MRHQGRRIRETVGALAAACYLLGVPAAAQIPAEPPQAMIGEPDVIERAVVFTDRAVCFRSATGLRR